MYFLKPNFSPCRYNGKSLAQTCKFSLVFSTCESGQTQLFWSTSFHWHNTAAKCVFQMYQMFIAVLSFRMLRFLPQNFLKYWRQSFADTPSFLLLRTLKYILHITIQIQTSFSTTRSKLVWLVCRVSSLLSRKVYNKINHVGPTVKISLLLILNYKRCLLFLDLVSSHPQ